MYRILVLTLAIAAVASAASIEGKIVSGQDAQPGQFPYIASFRRYGKHMCGASILNERYLLTAAHCVVANFPDSASVIVGTININGTGGDEYKTDSWITHPGWDPDTIQNDLAIIKLRDPIQFKPEDIVPMKLYEGTVGKDEEVIAAGWGYLWEWIESGPFPDVLQWLPVRTWSNADCAKRQAEWINITIVDSMLCSFSQYGEGVCGGDSGSPLALRGQQVGIASWANRCAKGFPDVWTRIEPYIDWIKSNSKV